MDSKISVVNYDGASPLGVTGEKLGNKIAAHVVDIGSGGDGGSSSGGGLSTYYAKPSGTNADATSAYASGTTLTVTGLPYSFTKYDIVSIRQIPNAGGEGAQDTLFTDVADFSVSGTTITVANASFSATDEFIVAFALPPKSINEVNDSQDVSVINGQWTRTEDVVTLISSAQTMTTSWADVGTEISTKGYRYITFWLTVDINNSNDQRIRAIAKHTASGSEEYSLVIKTVSASDVKIEEEYLEFNVDADQLVAVTFELGNTTPYVQLQAQVGTLGATAADLDAVYYTLGY